MDLQTFIAKSLKDIASGIDSARQEHPNRLPEQYEEENGVISESSGGWANLRPIDFDIAVTVSTSDSVEGGGGIEVMSLFKAGTDIAKTAEKSSVSRIKFSVPMKL